jgi:hypothetical protein
LRGVSIFCRFVARPRRRRLRRIPILPGTLLSVS